MSPSRPLRPGEVPFPGDGPHAAPTDPYAALGVPRDADEATIRRAYFQRVRDHPPEVAPAEFQAVRAAYERVSTPEIRAQTDLFLLQLPPPLPARRRSAHDLELGRDDIIRLALELRLAQLAVRNDFREPRIPR